MEIPGVLRSKTSELRLADTLQQLASLIVVISNVITSCCLVHAMQERKAVHRAKPERDSHIKHSTSNIEIEELMAPFCKLVSYMAGYFATHLEEQMHCYEGIFVFSRNIDTFVETLWRVWGMYLQEQFTWGHLFLAFPQCVLVNWSECSDWQN